MCFCEFSQFWRSDADLLATSLPKARPSAALLPVIHFPSENPFGRYLHIQLRSFCFKWSLGGPRGGGRKINLLCFSSQETGGLSNTYLGSSIIHLCIWPGWASIRLHLDLSAGPRTRVQHACEALESGIPTCVLADGDTQTKHLPHLQPDGAAAAAAAAPENRLRAKRRV